MKIYVFWCIWKWAWQNGSTAPPGTQPLGFHITDFHQNRARGVSWLIMKKSHKGHYEKRNRKPAILDLVAILAILAIFTLMYLSQGFHQINFKFRWVSSQQDGEKSWLKKSTFRHTVWPWRGVKVWLNAIKTPASVSSTYMIQSNPNYTHKTRVPAWRHIHWNHFLKSQRPLVATGNVFFFACLTLGFISPHPLTSTMSNSIKWVSRHW